MYPGGPDDPGAAQPTGRPRGTPQPHPRSKGLFHEIALLSSGVADLTNGDQAAKLHDVGGVGRRRQADDMKLGVGGAGDPADDMKLGGDRQQPAGDS